jgi:hypothetical protein
MKAACSAGDLSPNSGVSTKPEGVRRVLDEVTRGLPGDDG